MTNIFQNFMTGLEAGNRQADRNRVRAAQDEAGLLMTKGDTTGAARVLMAAGLYGDANTASQVSMTRRRDDAQIKAGEQYRAGQPGAAAGEFFGAGMIEEGEQARTRGVARDTGAAFARDPHSAAEVAALGGDVEMATRLTDWAERLDERGREEALKRNQVFAPVLYRAGQMPYEQRRAYIASQGQALSGLGFTPEQIAGFDPTDENIQSMVDTQLGIEKLLGTYSQREVGDEVRTYNTNPYGVRPVAREPIPITRDERRQDERLNLERERLERIPEVNSVGDVLGPLLSRYAAGEELSPQEQAIVDRHLEGGNTAMFGMGMGMPAAPTPVAPTMPRPPAATPAVPAAQPARSSGSGTQADPARPRTRQEAAALPSGTWFLDPSGNLLQR